MSSYTGLLPRQAGRLRIRLDGEDAAPSPANKWRRLPRRPIRRHDRPMARAPKLKVYRMAAGFHDAYVAAPSQKAAIAAWGADGDVFARGVAELVTDPALTAGPLARSGEIVKRLRGTAAEQIAALGAAPDPTTPKRAKAAQTSTRAPRPAKPPPPKPRPSRAALDTAEAALAEAEAHHAEALRAIEERQAALDRERAALTAKHDTERERLQARQAKAEAAYQEALRRWREG